MLWQLYFEYLTDVFYVTVKTSIVLLAFRVGDMLLPTFTHRILHQPLHFFIVRAGTNKAAAHQHCQMRKAANALPNARRALVHHSGSIAAAQFVFVALAAFREYRRVLAAAEGTREYRRVLAAAEGTHSTRDRPRSAFVELAAFHERDCRILPSPLRLLECV
jgi:hypothetical protein